MENNEMGKDREEIKWRREWRDGQKKRMERSWGREGGGRGRDGWKKEQVERAIVTNGKKRSMREK